MALILYVIGERLKTCGAIAVRRSILEAGAAPASSHSFQPGPCHPASLVLFQSVWFRIVLASGGAGATDDRIGRAVSERKPTGSMVPTKPS
jgi:hypothetical protein